MAEEQLRSVRVNWNSLTQLIDCSVELLAELYATDSDCLTLRQIQFIEAESVMTKKNERLLEIITLKSIAKFNKFLDCLNLTGQQHVVNLLSGIAGRSVVLNWIHDMLVCNYILRFVCC